MNTLAPGTTIPVSPDEMEEMLHTINGTPNTEHEQTFFTLPESYRYRGEGMVLPPTQPGDGYGLFFIRPKGGRLLKCIADDGKLSGWEHVSVSVVDQPEKCPSWLEMDAIKDLFWTEDAAVMQLHPPRADWVNNHAGCLHLWRPLAAAVPLPPAQLVGLKELNPEEEQA
jgi:hypothetical protein